VISWVNNLDMGTRKDTPNHAMAGTLTPEENPESTGKYMFSVS